MLLSGFEVSELGSLAATIETAVWMRREQFRVFETMIDVLSQGMTLSTDMANKVQRLMNQYIDLVVPGSETERKEKEATFMQNTAQSLNDITNILKGSAAGKIDKRSKSIKHLFGAG